MLYIDPINSTRGSWGSYYRGNESATMFADYLLLGPEVVISFLCVVSSLVLCWLKPWFVMQQHHCLHLFPRLNPLTFLSFLVWNMDDSGPFGSMISLLNMVMFHSYVSLRRVSALVTTLTLPFGDRGTQVTQWHLYWPPGPYNIRWRNCRPGPRSGQGQRVEITWIAGVYGCGMLVR
jgi:hypothetical protein